ncbi:MAG: hypothetical protein JSV17_16775, partial [Candidatus Aminicenantes bacterium]
MRNSRDFSNIFFKIFALSLFVVFLFQPALSQNQSIRIVKLKVVVDEEFRKTGDWRFELKQHVANASRVFEQNFGISFEIGTIESWSSDNSQNS